MKRELCALSIAGAVATAIVADAEVHRFDFSEITAEIVAVQEPRQGEVARFSFSSDEIAEKFPEIVRVVVTDRSAATGPQLRAVFATKSDSSEILESIEVEMEAANDGMYRVSSGSADALTTWLKPRFVQLMLGHLAIESVEGLSDGSVTIQIANTSMGESLKDSDEDAENIADTADRLSQTLVGLTGLAGRSLSKVGFRDMNGEGRLLSEFHGKTVLLHVWATWCAPCVAAMPGLQAMEERYRDQGLLVINLSDESVDVVENWLAANPTDMMHGRVDNFAFIAGDTDTDDHDMLRVRPVYIVLDREGNVRAQRVGGGSIQMKIVQGPDGARTSTTSDVRYLSEWVRPHL